MIQEQFDPGENYLSKAVNMGDYMKTFMEFLEEQFGNINPYDHIVGYTWKQIIDAHDEFVKEGSEYTIELRGKDKHINELKAKIRELTFQLAESYQENEKLLHG